MSHTSWAVFDFDHTLITHDSLPRFLKYHAGPMVFYGAVVMALLLSFFAHDRKTSLKRSLCFMLLRHATRASVAPAVQRLQQSLTWHNWVRERLYWHRQQGHKILIATGALELYMHDLLQDVPYDGLIGVTLAEKDGTFTGALSSPNTVREAKAEAVQAFLQQHQGRAIWGYGNWRDDMPMLALCDNPVIIGK